jgi:hypothetical protein
MRCWRGEKKHATGAFASLRDDTGDQAGESMDINYHYFAVKALARFSGFPEDDAQLLASYSQFVDDYDLFFNLHLDEVPAYARHLAVKGLDDWTFKPVTTGFRRKVDMLLLGSEENQRNIMVPFHCIPRFNLKQEVQDRAEWRTAPVTIGDGSLMDRLLADARNRYIPNTVDRYNLMRVGMLLHPFADTYAHQGFSGLNGWENTCSLDTVIDNASHEIITTDYSPFKFPIAHAEADTAPDDSNVWFRMKHRLEKNGPFVDYERSNTDEYMKISREIVNYLRSCQHRDPINDGDNDWKKFNNKLRKGLLTPLKEKDIRALYAHWRSIFPGYIFDYNRDTLLNDCFCPAETGEEATILTTREYRHLFLKNQGDLPNHLLSIADEVKSDDFFHFNVIAHEIRERVKGNIAWVGHLKYVLRKMRKNYSA